MDEFVGKKPAERRRDAARCGLAPRCLSGGNGHRCLCRRSHTSQGGFHRRECLALSAVLWD